MRIHENHHLLREVNDGEKYTQHRERKILRSKTSNEVQMKWMKGLPGF